MKKVTETELIGDIREDVLFSIKRKYQGESLAQTGFQWMANTVKDILDADVGSVNQVNVSVDLLGRMQKKTAVRFKDMDDFWKEGDLS